MLRPGICSVLIFLLTISGIVHSQSTIRIAVASNFKPAAEALIEQFQQTGKQNISISTASTGVLFAQIQNGAPFDLFLSADAHSVDQLNQQLNQFVYAKGQLVFWCPGGAPSSIHELTDYRGNYAVANPRLAPYGRAALQVVARLNWPESIMQVKANNIAQVNHFIATGAVDCGFAARSLLPTGTDKHQILNIPEHWHSEIIQKAAILTEAAADFSNFIQLHGGPIIKSHGYSLPTDP